MADDEKKIIVDEGWKSKVQREKAEAARKEPAAADADETADESEELSLFSSLVVSLATQAMFALGVIAPEGQQEVSVDLLQAKHIIDMLQVLAEKTAGNLDDQEKRHLTEAVMELQHIFMQRAQQLQAQSIQGAGIDPTALRAD